MTMTGLTSVTIPNSVTSINETAFAYCTALTSVIFTPTSTVTSIGQQAFQNCIALTSITIPISITSIGLDAFESSGLVTVTIVNSQLGISSPASGVSFYGVTVTTDLPPP